MGESGKDDSIIVYHFMTATQLTSYCSPLKSLNMIISTLPFMFIFAAKHIGGWLSPSIQLKPDFIL